MASVVTGVAINALPAATIPLGGAEIVPLMQGGVAKQATTQAIANLAAGSDVVEATVQGRAIGDGTGPVETLDEEQLSDMVWADFGSSFARRNPNTNNIGYMNVPPISTNSRALANNDCGQGIVVATAVARTYTLPNDATVPDLEIGYSSTFAVTDAGGSCVFALGAGVTLLDLRDGSTGSKTITGVGIATVWKTAANFWTINGSQNLA